MPCPYSNKDNKMTSLNVVITGASGLIGRSLGQYLLAQGHHVYAMHRDKQPPFYWQAVDNHRWEIHWDTSINVDAVIHLAGEPIANGRWHAAKKQAIYDSRIDSTRALIEQFKTLSTPPTTLISASAIGYYGDCGQQLIDEKTPAGNDFLARTAEDWEQAAQAATALGIRTVNLRTGLVLSMDGGLLANLVPLFNKGLGGSVGSGQQMMSWVSLLEIVRMIVFLVTHPTANGAFNLVSPHAVSNREFTKILATVLGRPAVMKLPTFVVSTALGEMGKLLLLSSAHVIPKQLQSLDYPFANVDLQTTLQSVLNNK